MDHCTSRRCLGILPKIYISLSTWLAVQNWLWVKPIALIYIITPTAAGIKVEKREDHMTMCELETRALSARRKACRAILLTKSMIQCTSLNTRSDKLRSCDNV